MTRPTVRGRRVLLRRGTVAASAVALSWALAGCSGTDGTPAAAVTSVSGIARLDVDQFASLAATPGVVLLDVRTPAEYASGHIAGAKNLDIEDPSFTGMLAALDPTLTYAVYCRSGNRSSQALAAMEAAGFAHAADLVDGIGAWTGDGRDLVR